MAALLALAVPTRAQLPPGDLYVSEFQAGAVVNVRAGGDLAGAPRFATGLSGPFGLCVGPGGALYVAEFLSGEVTVVTGGGDFTGAPAFAWGLEGPAALLCSPGQVWVAEMGSGEVTDVSAGGDFAAAPAFAQVPGSPTALLRDAGGTFWALSDAGLFDVTAGGAVAPGQAFAFGGGAPRALAERGGSLLVADYAAGTLVDASAGGDLQAAPVFAELFLPAGLLDLGGFGLFAVSDALDAVLDVSAGGDFATATPDAQGVAAEFLAGLAFVSTCGDGALQAGEACDDGNTTPGDGCSERCEVQLCSLPPAAGCHAAGRARLRVEESRPGREKLKAKLSAMAGVVPDAAFGDPARGATRVDLCIYDDVGALVGELRIDRASQLCEAKACWRTRRHGYRYRDRHADADGVRDVLLRSGAGSRVRLRGANQADKLRTELPTGIAAALQNAASARLQLVTSDGACFDAGLATVQEQGPWRFRAK